MKNLIESLKKIPPQKQKDLCALLNIAQTNTGQIPDKMITVTGVRQILKSLTPDELSVLRVVYEKHDGLTVGELEKRMGITGHAMEEITSSLSDKLLVCVRKNRQLINNRMDRVSGIKELSPFIRIVDASEISQILEEISSALRLRGTVKKQVPAGLSDVEERLIERMLEEGGIMLLEEIAADMPRASFDKILYSLLQSRKVMLCQLMRPEFTDMVILEKATAVSVASTGKSAGGRSGGHVNNGFLMLLNCMHTYDIISNFGLFFTRQQEFRKTDLKRVADAMIEVLLYDGTPAQAEYSAKLSIHLLYRLGCITAAKENVRISLDPLRKEIDDPMALLQRVLKSLQEQGPMHKSFEMADDVPKFELVREAMGIIKEIGPESGEYVRSVIFFHLLSRSVIEGIISERKALREKSSAVLNFLFTLGLAELVGGAVTLSSIGAKWLDTFSKKGAPGPDEEMQRSIFINPDFTLVIPLQEVSPDFLFVLLSHAELEKKDITVHARITKQSIVRAQKRGMSIDVFNSVLSSLAKNAVPQNLSFLIQEWYNQTVSLMISRSIVLKTSHPSFLDELIGGRHRISVVDRIAEHYAIIKKDDLDEVLRIANKKDVIIRLFEEDEAD